MVSTSACIDVNVSFCTHVTDVATRGVEVYINFFLPCGI